MALSKQEKEKFLNDFIGSVQKSMIEKLDRVPEEWDGIELREWVADAFDWERKDFLSNNRKRRKDYKNAIITKDLI